MYVESVTVDEDGYTTITVALEWELRFPPGAVSEPGESGKWHVDPKLAAAQVEKCAACLRGNARIRNKCTVKGCLPLTGEKKEEAEVDVLRD